MNNIEKRARQLLAAEFNVEGREQFERGQAVVVTTASATNAIVAALTIREGELLARGSVNLLGEESPSIVPVQELDVVPSAALGADEAGAVGIGDQGDHPVGVELAEVASEHADGVLQTNDGHVTPQWQPIETAAKTAGTAVLGWDGYDMLVTYWCDRPHGRGGWYEREDRYETFYWEPTHWMPLPAEPGVTQ